MWFISLLTRWPRPKKLRRPAPEQQASPAAPSLRAHLRRSHVPTLTGAGTFPGREDPATFSLDPICVRCRQHHRTLTRERIG